MTTKEKNAHIFERDDLDWYVEEPRAVDQLLSVERFIGSIHDPACGRGTIVEACQRAGYWPSGSDIVCRFEDAPHWFEQRDFLAAEYQPRFCNIITNPPFFKGKGTEGFIRRALAVTSGKVCVFASIKFLAGSARANGLYTELPPSRVWIITPRVSCPSGKYLEAGNKAGGGTDDWCWFVWDQTAPRASAPALGWLKGAR